MFLHTCPFFLSIISNHGKNNLHTHDNKNHTIDVQNGLTVMEGLFKMIFQELMLIVVVEWLVLLAMFMSKKNG